MNILAQNLLSTVSQREDWSRSTQSCASRSPRSRNWEPETELLIANLRKNVIALSLQDDCGKSTLVRKRYYQAVL